MTRHVIPLGTWVDYFDGIWQVTGVCCFGNDFSIHQWYCLVDADCDHAFVPCELLEKSIKVAPGRQCEYIRHH